MEIHKILKEEQTELVSIVIPAFNAQDFMRNCLDSAVSQTYGNIEIIIVDDGSTDGTGEICREYAEKDKRIRIFGGGHKGVSYARNIGINNARGKYIAFFDADDYAEKELIENYVGAYKFWKDKEVAMVICGMYMDNLVNRNVTNRKRILENQHGYIEGEEYLISKASASLLAWLRLFNFVTNKCYELDRIRDGNIRFDEGVFIGEDLKFNLDYLEGNKGNLGVINRALYHYVKRVDDSLSISYHPGDLEDTKSIYNRFIAWEEAREGVTEDNLLVLKSIYLTDWTMRLKDIYENSKKEKGIITARVLVNKEIRSKQFRQILSDIHRGKKISNLRYICLRSGRFELFYFFRGIYQMMKG